MDKILITGESGFIGNELKKYLKNNFEIVPFGRLMKKDITKKEDFKGLEADVVIHLASVLRGEPEKMLKTNINGTINVLEFCKENNSKMIFSSSCAVYGNAQSPIKEDFPLNPINCNGLAKKIEENICKFYNKQFNIDCTILRLFNVYGPGQKKGFIIPDIIAQIKQREIVLGNPYPKRDYVYMGDVVKAICKSIQLEGFNIINIGSGKSYSVRNIAERISKKKIKFRDETKINSDIYANIEKARKKLDWEPKISLEEGLNKILKDINYSN